MTTVKIFALAKRGEIGIYEAVPCERSHGVYLRVAGRPISDWLTFLDDKYVSIDVLLASGELRTFPIIRKESCSMATQDWVASVIKFIREGQDD